MTTDSVASPGLGGVGSLLTWPVRRPLIVGLMLAGHGTSVVSTSPADAAEPTFLRLEQTTAGMPVASAGTAIAELRRLSGLTWDQLAHVCGVSRRTLHFWASGKPMTPGNEEHLQRVLAVVRQIDRGSMAENRAALLNAGATGTLPLDLLAAREYDRVISLAGVGTDVRVRPQQPAPETLAERAPPPPAELVGALQDRIHPASGQLRAAKPIRGARRE